MELGYVAVFLTSMFVFAAATSVLPYGSICKVCERNNSSPSPLRCMPTIVRQKDVCMLATCHSNSNVQNSRTINGMVGRGTCQFPPSRPFLWPWLETGNVERQVQMLTIGTKAERCL